MGSVVSDYIVTRPSDGLVVVGTHGNGVFSSNLTDINQLITGINFENTLKGMELKNYPNPFSNSTTIEYSLKEGGRVEMQILDELGQVVATLISKEMTAGTYTESFDRKGLASGIYYCSLKVNNQKTAKMLLIK
jgi:hypothetical protein